MDGKQLYHVNSNYNGDGVNIVIYEKINFKIQNIVRNRMFDIDKIANT